MAFDQTTRNRLQKFVGDARGLLAKEFTRQLQNDYGMDPETGNVSELGTLTYLDDARMQTARLLRDTLEHYRASSPSGGSKEHLERIIREQSFTVFNRLCALRMAEARGILIESIGNGYNSKGFQLYSRLAGTSLGEIGDAYRGYLFSLFDEFAVDLAVLFDRFSSMGRPFPRESALLELLGKINDVEIEPLWAEDETIGWIYQYFNSKEERKKMRDESQAPRNSRELAVRNQFFTPRYVVEFLTDNTLGRIWYEMTQGNTALKDFCRYLVRRPNEIFLAKSEEAPDQKDPTDDLSQEELLKQPVYIQFRPLKDPRKIRMLDPACGSMHFGLYAFDLFERIYEEAWDMQSSGQWPEVRGQKEGSGLRLLTEDYSSKEEFLRDVPRLIIEHNIHGVDIDPLAVQIAGLSLWLRAQRTWKEQNVKPADRPQIRKANIVCAEPMPGEKDMLREFTATLKPRVLGQLLEIIFDKMKLAGEAGSLLKIEEEIEEAIEVAREAFNKELLRRKAGEQQGLFPQLEKPKQISLFDFADLPDKTQFWQTAEQQIFDSLRNYAENTGKQDSSIRRLFAEDTAKGFAFIDICRKRFDVVLMNPPFGLGPRSNFNWMKTAYQDGYVDIYAAFLVRGLSFSCGAVGAITSRSWLITKKLQRLRKNTILSRIHSLLDLGWPVMDDATVHSCASVIDKSQRKEHTISVFNRRFWKNKDDALSESVKFQLVDGTYLPDRSEIQELPQGELLYQLPSSLLSLLRSSERFSENVGIARQGMKTFDDFRFIRLRTECKPEDIGLGKVWEPLTKGGPFSMFYSELPLVVRWQNGGLEVSEANRKVNGQTAQARQASEHYRKSGGTYSRRCKDFGVRALPSGFIIGEKGPAILPNHQCSPQLAIGLLNSRVIKILVNIQANAKQYDTGIIDRLPSKTLGMTDASAIENSCTKAIDALRNASARQESETLFLSIPFARSLSDVSNLAAIEYKKTQADVAQSLDDINHVVDRVYSIDSCSLLDSLNEEFGAKEEGTETGENISDPDDGIYEEKQITEVSLSPEIAERAISYLLGISYGRWDARIAMDPSLAPNLTDPFEPLPVCPPGMLVGPNGLPAKFGFIVSEEWLRQRQLDDGQWTVVRKETDDWPLTANNYPLRITWSGILVNDEGHPEDIVSRVREATEVIWKDTAGDIEQEACEILGVRSLREYFDKPTNFFADHLKRYSKSRRQAPIYWPLSTASGLYTLWIYYHRLTDQTLFSCVLDFVEPKLSEVSRQLSDLRQKQNRSSSEEKELELLYEFEMELKDFRAELLRIARFWKPNLNDGVQITAAPLWKLFLHKPWQKKLKETWNKLEKGDYDWAHLAYSIWPDRVIRASHKDRSYAIAHDLESDLWEEIENGADRQGNPKYKRVPKDLNEQEMRKLIAEKTTGDA